MKRLYGLDALRGIAALAVAMHHLWRQYQGVEFPILPQLAVDLFFILSGFVMARTYEAQMRDGLTAGRFILLRYRRLFLPLAVGTTLGLTWAILEVGVQPGYLQAYVLALAFLPAWWMGNAFLFNVPAWSLFLEISANGLHGLALGRMSNRSLIILWISMTVVFVALFFAGVGEWGFSLGEIISLLPRELSCYIMGILICRFYGDKPLGNSPMVALAAFAILLSVSRHHPMIELIAVVIAFPLILRASLAMEPMQWAIWLGALSYPLYATHLPAMKLAAAIGIEPGGRMASAFAVAIGVTAFFEMRRAAPSPAKGEWRPQALRRKQSPTLLPLE